MATEDRIRVFSVDIPSFLVMCVAGWNFLASAEEIVGDGDYFPAHVEDCCCIEKLLGYYLWSCEKVRPRPTSGPHISDSCSDSVFVRKELRVRPYITAFVEKIERNEKYENC